MSGALKDPDISIDVAETGLRGAAAVVLGTVLTPVAAVIPYVEMGLEEDSDCAALIALARQDAGNTVPPAAKGAPQN